MSETRHNHPSLDDAFRVHKQALENGQDFCSICGASLTCTLSDEPFAQSAGRDTMTESATWQVPQWAVDADRTIRELTSDRDSWKLRAELAEAALKPEQQERDKMEHAADDVLGFVKDLSASAAVPQQVRLKALELLKNREAAYDKGRGVK
jgi:hypothetical protein